MKKALLIGLAGLFLVIGLILFGLHMAINQFDEGLKHDIATHPTDWSVSINSPGCFLPDSPQDIKTLLNKLTIYNSWTVISTSDISRDPNLNGLLAYRFFEGKGKLWSKSSDGTISLDNPTNPKNPWCYQVALVNLKNKDRFIGPFMGYKRTLINCDVKNFDLKVHWTFKFGTQSRLLFENKTIGLIIVECSDDTNREFTKEALNIVKQEIAKLN